MHTESASKQTSLTTTACLPTRKDLLLLFPAAGIADRQTVLDGQEGEREGTVKHEKNDINV